MRGLLAPLIKLIVFLLITAALFYVLAGTISNQAYGEKNTYKAMFTDVTGLNEGDDIRIAGVRVGTVDAIEMHRPTGKNKDSENTIAQVTFTVVKDRPLPVSVTARLRYRNLVGQRYIDIEQNPNGSQKTLKPGGTIPLDQTYPAVDLTVLFEGFKPLVQGLDPGQINKLSLEVVQTLQGEGGSLQLLLSNLADLTNSLADKDKLIGDVVDNLTSVLTAIGNRDTELSNLIVQLKNFVSGLAADRKTIGNAIVGINGLATSTAGLLTQVRAPLAKDVKDITGLVAVLNRNSPTLSYVLQQLPPTVAGLIRTAQYGSWFNFYLCSVSGKVRLPGGLSLDLSLVKKSPQARCQ